MSEMVKLIDEYISKCENCSDEKAECLIQEIVSTFSADIPNITSDLCCYLIPRPPQIDHSYDLMVLKDRLIRYKAKIEDEKEDKTSKYLMFSMSQNQTNTQVVNISFEQTVNAVKSIPENELSADEKKELLEKLRKLEAEKEDKSKLWETARSVVKWIADRGVDVAIAVLPYIVEVLKNPK